MLTCLERRGYIQRDPLSGAYSLTLRLYELSHAHSPFRRLLRAAARPMRELTETLRESCHLSVLQRGKLLVLAQEESPARLRLSVEVGGTFPPLHTVSGRLLLAHLPESLLQEALDGEYDSLGTAEWAALLDRLAAIRARGYETAVSETIEGVSDVAVLVGSFSSSVQAALAIASLTRERETFLDRVLPALRQCAETIGRSAGTVV
jgi:DNA-binding IclR family transcriptional regulator